MKILDTQVKKQGFTYDLIHRSKFNAIYSQKCNDSGRLVAYEVFRINKNEEREIAGQLIAASEGLPGNEQFGQSAWSYSISGSNPDTALEKARRKFAELEQWQAEKEKRDAEKAIQEANNV